MQSVVMTATPSPPSPPPPALPCFLSLSSHFIFSVCLSQSFSSLLCFFSLCFNLLSVSVPLSPPPLPPPPPSISHRCSSQISLSFTFCCNLFPLPSLSFLSLILVFCRRSSHRFRAARACRRAGRRRDARVVVAALPLSDAPARVSGTSTPPAAARLSSASGGGGEGCYARAGDRAPCRD